MADPAVERPAVAEATLEVNGHPLRAHAAADHLEEAVDLLEDRLRPQLEHLSSHLHTRQQRPVPNAQIATA
jgi:ribosome-associated translation inhibitor RaiA